MPKAVLDGWLEIGEEPKSTIPKMCKYCGTKLHKVDVSRLIGKIIVYCPNYKCRLWLEFEA